jgi:hypothetical protein
MTHICAWPGCEAEGTFPAPKDPRNLSERQYFCQPHIKEFNKNWNGMSGFNESEIFSMQSGAATWNRPTWGMGVNGAKLGPSATAAFATADDLYSFFQDRIKQEGLNSSNMGARIEGPAALRQLPDDVQEALVIFNLQAPADAATLKPKYHALVKQHHPDVNPSEGAAEHIKRINVAYKILTEFIERRGV